VTRRDDLYVAVGGVLVGLGLLGLALGYIAWECKRLERRAIEVWEEAYSWR